VDHANLVIALKRMKDVATEINEKKRDAETFSVMMDIYNRFDGEVKDLCAAHRKFVKEGQLKEEGAYFLWFLFNDILLKTRERDKRKVRLLAHITLKTASIVDLVDDKAKSIKNSFQIVTPKKTMTVKVKTPEEKKEWMTAIQDNITNQVEKSKTFVNLQRNQIDEV